MDDEGMRLAGLSDEEWAKRVAKIEREVNREKAKARRRTSHSRTQLLTLGLAAVVTIGGVLIYALHGSSGGSPVSAPASADLANHVPFSGTPAAAWHTAATGLVMPRATKEGPYSAAAVAGALARAKVYLTTARTSTAVLSGHQLTPLIALASSVAGHVQTSLYATYLAPGNTLAAQPRVDGVVTLSFVKQTGTIGEHLVVSGNLIWVYALKASYPVAASSDGTVSLHEHIELAFYLDPLMDGPHARVTPQRDAETEYAMDCGYSNDDMLGLPRVDDPRRVPTGSDTLPDQYNVSASVTAPTTGCLPRK